MESINITSDETIGQGNDVSLMRLTRQNVFTSYHRHEYFEFFFLAEGRLTECRNGKKFQLRSGDTLLIRPGDCHGYPEWKSENFVFYNMCIRPSYWYSLSYKNPVLPWKEIQNANSPLDLRLRSDDFKYILYTMKWLMNLSDSDTMSLACGNLITRMALQFWSHGIQRGQNDTPPWLIQILDRLNDPVLIKKGLPYIRTLSPVSQEHFSRLFKKHVGQTPSRYLMNKRIHMAKSLLSGSDMNITELAEECGYDNLSHFHHQFKENTGLSPLKFRKKSNPEKVLLFQ